MNIISRKEWGAQTPAEVNDFDEEIVAWFTHWVGAEGLPQRPTLEQSKARMRSLQEDAMDEGYDDFEYNFAVDPEGRIFEGRGWLVQSGATFHNNTNSLSVVYLAGPGVLLTEEAKAALLWLTQEGARRNPKLTAVKPHRLVYNTQCPGDQLTVFTQHDLNSHLNAPEVDWQSLAALAAWAKRRLTNPLEWKKRDPDVLILKALLKNLGYKGIKPGPYYGDNVRRAIYDVKRHGHLTNRDGKICGADCAKAILTSK